MVCQFECLSFVVQLSGVKTLYSKLQITATQSTKLRSCTPTQFTNLVFLVRIQSTNRVLVRPHNPLITFLFSYSKTQSTNRVLVRPHNPPITFLFSCLNTQSTNGVRVRLHNPPIAFLFSCPNAQSTNQLFVFLFEHTIHQSRSCMTILV